VLCSQCGTNLPDGSQFCPHCEQPRISAANSKALVPVPASGLAIPQPFEARRQHRLLLWLLVLVFLGALLFVAISESTAVQQVQEFMRWSHTESIVDSALSVNPRSFSSCKFTVPPSATGISIIGEFSVTPGSPRQRGNAKASGKEDRDTGVEAYVLTDSAFAVWSSGYSTETQYESGSVPSATINALLPSGAGVYHLVFSNKNSARAKTVHATVLLRYKSWLPDAIVRLKDQFWGWIGLALVY
jgi:hypothetical protein